MELLDKSRNRRFEGYLTKDLDFSGGRFLKNQSGTGWIFWYGSKFKSRALANH